MNPELRQFIEQTQFRHAVVQQVVNLLPADDAELDELLAEVVASNNLKWFMYVFVAAAGAGRRVAARHLVGGAMMFPEYRWLGMVAMRMHGDVPEPLLTALETSQLDRVCEAAALHLIWAWCAEHRGGVLPDKFMPLVRALARRVKQKNHDDTEVKIFSFVCALAFHTQDAGLVKLLRQRFPSISDGEWKRMDERSQELSAQILAGYRESLLDFVNEKPKQTVAEGETMRRAVARVGRNEPCPCGSGKKYKHCCIAKDQERLHRSSDVAGVTHEELFAKLEDHLTAERLVKIEPYELARLDPAKIPAALRDAYILRLAICKLFDQMATAFELLGYTPERKELWKNVMFMATRAGHKAALRRLVKLYPDPVKVQDEIYTGAALLLAEDEPAELLKLLDDSVTQALEKDEAGELEGSSIAMMLSRFAGLGILVGRGTIPILPEKEASRVFEEILRTRDKLNLSPDDPIAELFDQRFADPEDDLKKESAELRQTRQKFAAKAQEVQNLKESLARLHKEITRREQRPTAAAQLASPTQSNPADDPAVKEMRRKLTEMKTALNERHHERNDLRRELQKANADLETLRQKATTAAPEALEPADREEELFLPQDAPEVHPVRVIEFPKGFQATLAGFPRHVARAAMIMMGRLAAGEPAAFVGALRLKAMPNVMRQRIGSDYRLLFRLHPDHLQVIDLINRKDLDRRLKTVV
jgi:hypothetical protein